MTAGTGAEAFSAAGRPCDCVVLDLRLPDMSGFEVLEDLRGDAALSDVPVVVFTGRELSAEEDAELHTMARSIVVKGVELPERLFDETALFLHRIVTDLPSEKQRMLERLNSSDEDLVGRTVLLIDDDARNIFALSSVNLSDVPVVVFTGRELSAEEDAQLFTMARSIVVKGVESPGAPARRDRAVPAPRRDRPPAGEATHARTAQQLRRGLWSGAPCCWSTTTPATSSRCRACWSGAGCKSSPPRPAARRSRSRSRHPIWTSCSWTS